MKTLFFLTIPLLLAACSTPGFLIPPFSARTAETNRLKSDFRSGQCAENIQNAERWFDQTVKSRAQNAMAYNSLAWLLITCPNRTYVNPKRSLEIMAQAANVQPLTVPQRDTVACAYAASGNFARAIELANKFDLVDPTSNPRETRADQFRRGSTCKWDETIITAPVTGTDAQMVESKNRTERYLRSLQRSQAAIKKTPPDLNSAFLACQDNHDEQNVYFCNQQLSNRLITTTSDRFTECEKFEKDQKAADRCYKFYFENMGGNYPIGNCSTALCRKSFCLYRQKECESK